MTVRSENPTLEEFLLWPEQKPYLEFIRGEVREKSMPDFPHGELQIEFGGWLREWSKPRKGRTMGEQRCILEADGEKHTVLPDVAWWAIERLPAPATGPIRIAPDVAIEILSPNDRYGEVNDKIQVYLKAGVPLTWIVDPFARSVTVYRPGAEPEVVRGQLQDATLPGLSIPLPDVFSVCDAPPRVQE